jgi:protein phosphatase 1 regulatory subunit 10
LKFLAEIKNESDSDESKQTSSGDGEDSKPICKLFPNGVLVHKARRGPKKSVKWKEEKDLITIKLFELDETERVNVTRNFVDMKLIERSHEREAFRMARKLGKLNKKFIKFSCNKHFNLSIN